MCCAVCAASPVTGVRLWDLGNGTCRGAYLPGGNNWIEFNCTVENNVVFGGQKCKTYKGEIYLYMLVGSTEQPDFQKWMTNVGLGDLVTAGKCTSIVQCCTQVLVQLAARCCKTVVQLPFSLRLWGCSISILL
jgi:hypothetical protein